MVVYGSASFGVLQGIDILSTRLGLPDALFIGTLVIAALALPVVVATALVYGAERARDANPGDDAAVRASAPPPAGEADHAAKEAGDGRAAAPSSPRKRGRLAPLLTWRRSTALIAAAFALLVLATAGFMASRALGIGPAATLLARGVLEARDPIIIAEFDSAPADSSLARVVTDAFRIDFSQSPSITVVQPQQVQQTLQLMGRAADARLDATLAIEVAQRRGVKALVTGELASAGRGFLLTARVVTADSAIVLAAHRESAADAEALIAAIDRLSKRLRERIGESLRTVRAEPLAQVTTGSLDALRYYTQAVRAADVEGDDTRALALLENAVRADSTFAMAHRKTGIIVINRGLGFDRAASAFESAYRHRDRLSARERHLTEAAYYTYVTLQLDEAKAAYRMVLTLDPDNETALNNLAVQLMNSEELVEAEALLRHALALDSTVVTRYINLGTVQVRLRRDDDAARTLEAMRVRFGDTPHYEQVAALHASAVFDYARAAEHADRLAAHGRSTTAWRQAAFQIRMSLLMLQGRLAEAERLARNSLGDLPTLTPEAVPLTFAIGRAQLAVLREDRGALAALDAAVRETPPASLPPLQQPLLQLASAYAQLGRPAVALTYLQQFDTSMPEPLRRAMMAPRLLTEAEIALVERRFDDALHALDRAAEEPGCHGCADAARSRVYDAAAHADSAIAAAERYVALRDPARIFHDAIELPRAYERLARLYDERGDAERARAYYARLIDLWQDADPELQPYVDAARVRLRALLEA
jgi:eukaryotic-like serine/threonine-protein kinase